MEPALAVTPYTDNIPAILDIDTATATATTTTTTTTVSKPVTPKTWERSSPLVSQCIDIVAARVNERLT
jgi:hypothetical protein